MQAHSAAAELLESDAPDFKAYEAKLRHAAELMVVAHVAAARSSVEARDVLTAPQRAQLKNLQSSRMGMKMDGGKSMGGMSGKGGMMPPCMMMPEPSGEMHNHKH